MSKIINLLVGEKFGRFTIIGVGEPIICGKRKRSTRRCQCECGVFKDIELDKLKSGNTTSCGCYRKEVHKNNPNLVKYKRVMDPKEASIKRIFYGWRYDDGNLTIEQFSELIKLNCFYCNSPPTKEYNAAWADKKSPKYALEDGNIKYNGLDRLNNNLPHNVDNVIPCCTECNMCKNIFSYDEFIKWIKKTYKYIKLTHPFNYDLTSANFQYTEDDFKNHGFKNRNQFIAGIKRRWKSSYDNGNITAYNFYKLSQQNCYYCDLPPSNKVLSGWYTTVFVSGLDRINNVERDHNIDNVVPCCKMCNRVKRNRSYQEFVDWINVIYANLVSFNRL